MAEKAFRERLREIDMSQYDHELYTKYFEGVKRPIQQLRNILDGLEAKKKERQWLKHQVNIIKNLFFYFNSSIFVCILLR